MPQPSEIPSSDAKAEAKVRFDFIARVHVYTHDYIRFADTKASAILAACGFLFTGLFTRGDAFGSIIQKSPSSRLTLLVLFFGVAALLSLLATIGHSVACVMPRLGSRGKGLVYWDQVAKHSSEDYIQAVSSLSGDEAVTQLANHVRAVSETAQKKYVHVSKALCWLCATLGFSLVVSLLLIWISATTTHS
jgi:hypothetical protein